MTWTLKIDDERCRACGECLRECIHPQADASGTRVDHDTPACELCFHCFAACPAGAIRIYEDGAPVATDEFPLPAIAPEALEHFLAYRRSTRRYRQEPVPPDVLERVVQTGRYIPSGGNRHAYEFTVLTDDGIKARLLDAFARHYGRVRKLMSSAFLRAILGLVMDAQARAFLRDPEYGRRMKEILDDFASGGDPVFYGAPAVVIIHSPEIIPTPKADSVLAGYNMVLMAQALGLGTCFVTLAQSALNMNRRAKAIAGLAPDENVHAVVLVGYPAVHYRRGVPKPEKVPRSTE